MTTILVFPFNLLSHYLRCLVLADTYNKEEYNILFQSSDVYNKFVDLHGYQTFSCEQFDSKHVMECSKKFDFSWINEPSLERITLAQILAIQTLKADMVIGDVAPSLKMAAELTKVTYLSLMNGYMTKYYASTRRVPRMHRAYRLLRELPGPVSDRITDFAEKVTFRIIHKPFKNLRRKFGLEYISDYMSEMEGDQNLICDLPELFPQRTLPSNYAYTGPLIYQYNGQESSWLDDITKQKPVICVCMGSSGDWNRLKFLNDLYYSRYTIITAGDLTKVLVAPHIISKDFVNLNQVLSKANLLICHAGNGTIYFGILTQVYMLCLSDHFEQEWNMNALEKNGYGKSADKFDRLTWKTQINNAVKKSYLRDLRKKERLVT